MTGAAWRLVSYGNAFLLGRYDGDSLAKAAISQGITRWQFDTLLPRPHGIAPLRTVARDPYGWFRWLRKQGYRRLVLRWFSPADYAALDGPLKVFTTAERRLRAARGPPRSTTAGATCSHCPSSRR